MKKLLNIFSKVKVPKKIIKVWGSYDFRAIKNEKDKSLVLREVKPKGMKYHSELLNLKEYPKVGEHIKFFVDLKYVYEYKCTSNDKRDSLTSDPAMWDNCREYDFVFVVRSILKELNK